MHILKNTKTGNYFGVYILPSNLEVWNLKIHALNYSEENAKKIIEEINKMEKFKKSLTTK